MYEGKYSGDFIFYCKWMKISDDYELKILMMASYLAGNEPLSPAHPEWENFYTALRLVAEDLAKSIARDGEGATKLIEVEVVGAVSDEEARKIAKSVVGSPLVMDGLQHISTASLAPDLFCVTFSGLSKSHMVCGYYLAIVIHTSSE